MAQWVASANSLGQKFIDDPRVDEQARIGQLLLADRAQRQDEAARREAMAFQAQQAAERARQFDEDLGFRRGSEAFQQAQAGRLFDAQRADAERRFGLEQSAERRMADSADLARTLGMQQAERAKASDLRDAESMKRQSRVDFQRHVMGPLLAEAGRRLESQDRERARSQDRAERAAEEKRQRQFATEQTLLGHKLGMEADAARYKSAETRAEASAAEATKRQEAEREARAAAERAAQEAETAANRKVGMQDALQRFLARLAEVQKQDLGGGEFNTAIERATREAFLPPAEEVDVAAGGGRRPTWRPTTPEEFRDLRILLERTLGQNFPVPAESPESYTGRHIRDVTSRVASPDASVLERTLLPLLGGLALPGAAAADVGRFLNPPRDFRQGFRAGLPDPDMLFGPPAPSAAPDEVRTQALRAALANHAAALAAARRR